MERGAEKAYRLLLRLLPPSLRRVYGDEMVTMFLDRQRHALEAVGGGGGRPEGTGDQRRESRLSLLGIWLREFPALVSTAIRARWRPEPSFRRVADGSGEEITGAAEGAGGLAASGGAGGRPPGSRRSALDAIAYDLRTAWRSLRGSPGFALVSILVLALGIGANAAIFSVVYGVLQDLPYPGGERFDLVYEDRAGDRSSQMALSAPEFLALEEDGRVFDQLAAYHYSGMLLGGDPYPERVGTVVLSHDFMDLLDARPLQGREFTESDSAEDRLVVVGYELWQRRWGGDPDLVGETITLDDEPYRVIGITDPEFTYFNDTNRLYTLLTIGPERASSNGLHNLYVLGRRRAEIGVAEADELVAAAATPAQEIDDHAADEQRTVYVHSLYDAWVGSVRPSLLTLMGAVLVLVLIACSNVANLEIARGLARRREIAVRLALGAAPRRIVRQLMTESVLLALVGGVVGMALAWLSMSALQSLISTNLPRADNIELDLSVFGFALALALVTGALAGAAPAWVVSRQELVEPIKEGSATVAGGRGATWLRKGFLVVQVSLALILTVGAGLLVRTVDELSAVDLGFDPEGVVVGNLSLRGRPEYREPTVALQFLDRVAARISAHPEIDGVGATNLPPGVGFMITEEFVVGESEEPEPVVALQQIVTPGFFEALRIEPLRGRVLTEADDRPGAEPVVLVTDDFAREHWSLDDAVGKRIRVAGDEASGLTGWRTVVGVVSGMKTSPFQQQTMPGVYLPSSWMPLVTSWMLIRSDLEPSAVAEWTRSVVHDLDEALPVPTLASLDETVGNRIARQRLNSVLLAIFAAIALLLAAVGEYAVIQYGVRQRTSELGVRLALGARSGEVVSMVLRQGMVLAVVGVAVGLAGAWGASRLIESMLWGVEPTDLPTYLATATFLLVVAAIATWLPAWRAGRVDPVIALRNQ